MVAVVSRSSVLGVVCGLVAGLASFSVLPDRVHGSPFGPGGLRLDDGPRFFSINRVLGRESATPSAAPEPVATAPAWGRLRGTLDPTVPRGASDPFASLGYRLFGSGHPGVTARYDDLRERERVEAARVDACLIDRRRCGDRAVRQAADIVREVRGLQGRERIEAVNRLVNESVVYLPDLAADGVADHWRSPLQTLGDAGDCEDYAFAKRFLLARAGTPAADMRVILLRDRRAGEDHAVLAVRDGERWLVLDNRWGRLDDDHALAHYRPVFELSHGGVRVYAAPFAADAEPVQVGLRASLN